MTKRFITAVLCAGMAFTIGAARADEASDLADMKAQLRQLQRQYTGRISALEKRLATAEAVAKAARETAAAAASNADTANKSAAAAQSTAQTASVSVDTAMAAFQQSLANAPPPAPTSNNAFNPGISAVLNGFYAASSHDTKNARIAGVAQGGDAGLMPRGFSLGESEVTLAANIDPELTGFLDFSFHGADSVGVEEAYIQSSSLPGGLTLKGGRFLSSIGYLNERHAHNWSFSDQPLPYRAFLNNQYGDDGLQLRWLAPTDLFLEFGAEAFRGDSYPAAGARNSGAGTYTAFVHTGADINDSSSWLAAASYLHSDAVARDTGGHLFNGATDLGIVSGVYKWSPGGNPTVNNLVLTSELFYDRQAGSFDAIPVSQNRWSFYAQGVYQFMPRWSVGLRYSALSTRKIPLALTSTDLNDFGHLPDAETALLEFDTSEFGRFRVQYTHDHADLKPNDEILLQYTVMYGPHAAHRY